MTSEKPLHPKLDLPYREWIPIAEQKSAGSVWRYKLSSDKMALIRQLVTDGKALVANKRKTWDKDSEDYSHFVQMVFLKASAREEVVK